MYLLGVRRSALFVAALACFACADRLGDVAESEPVEIVRVTELWASPGDEGLGLLPTVIVGGMVEVRGDVWVGDPRAGHVLVLDRSGRAMRAIGGRGEGPGEFQSVARLIGLPEGGAAVYDIAASALHVFNSGGEFQQRIGLEPRFQNPKGMVADAGGFVFAGGLPGSEQAIHRVGKDGDLIASWYPIPVATSADLPPRVAAENGLYTAGGPLARTSNGDLLFSQAAPHRILRFVAGDTAGRVVAQDPELLAPAVDTFTSLVDGVPESYDWLFPQSSGVFELADRRILNVVTFHGEGRSLWQVYAPSGEIVAIGEVDRAYFPWSLTTSGTVLVSYEDAAEGNPVVAEVEIDLR